MLKTYSSKQALLKFFNALFVNYFLAWLRNQYFLTRFLS